MEGYDPSVAPDAAEWLATDEGERIEVVRDYHQRTKVPLPNATVHEAMHVMVENQVAMGDELTVRGVVDRLQAEGLDRHAAAHAVGSVLAEQLLDLMKRGLSKSDPNERYRASLEKLTARGWLRSR